MRRPALPPAGAASGPTYRFGYRSPPHRDPDEAELLRAGLGIGLLRRVVPVRRILRLVDVTAVGVAGAGVAAAAPVVLPAAVLAAAAVLPAAVVGLLAGAAAADGVARGGVAAGGVLRLGVRLGRFVPVSGDRRAGLVRVRLVEIALRFAATVVRAAAAALGAAVAAVAAFVAVLLPAEAGEGDIRVARSDLDGLRLRVRRLRRLVRVRRILRL